MPKTPVSRREGFQIRAIKLKSLDSKKKEHLKHPKTDFNLASIETAELNFSVLKVQINERLPRKLRFRQRLGLDH